MFEVVRAWSPNEKASYVFQISLMWSHVCDKSIYCSSHARSLDRVQRARRKALDAATSRVFAIFFSPKRSM